jgi:hypothetical protein
MRGGGNEQLFGNGGAVEPWLTLDASHRRNARLPRVAAMAGW